MLLIPYVVSIVVILSLTLLFLRSLQSRLKEQDSLIQNLMNRLQAANLETYQRLQNSSDLTDKYPVAYVPQTDEAELARIRSLTGLGEEDYEDDIGAGVFTEAFGLEFGSIPGREQSG